MPLSQGQRRSMAEKYAHLLGGTDSEGREHKLARKPDEADAKRAQHLFAVIDNEKENMSWAFVNGRQVSDFIDSGRYTVEYLGANRDHLKNKKVRDKMLEQVKQHVDAVKAKHARHGRFETDGFYKSLLDEKTNELTEKFDTYDKSKETS